MTRQQLKTLTYWAYQLGIKTAAELGEFKKKKNIKDNMSLLYELRAAAIFANLKR